MTQIETIRSSFNEKIRSGMFRPIVGDCMLTLRKTEAKMLWGSFTNSCSARRERDNTG